MLEIYQKTLSENVTFKGIGLHTGKSSTITVMPGKENDEFTKELENKIYTEIKKYY